MHVDYSGGCEIFIEAETVLGRSAKLAIKVTKFEGLARLQLTQDPYSHWSFSCLVVSNVSFVMNFVLFKSVFSFVIFFLKPPDTQFEVKSQLLPQITALIISQVSRISI